MLLLWMSEREFKEANDNLAVLVVDCPEPEPVPEPVPCGPCGADWDRIEEVPQG